MAGLMETIEKMQCQICTLFDKFKEQQEEGIVSSINSPNNTITIGGDGSIVTVDIEQSILDTINSALQPGDNVSELVNDAGYAVSADLHPVATSGSYNDLEDVPSSFPPNAHTHPISDIINLQAALDSKENLANKGVANGYAGLDGGGKVPIAQLPNSIMEYKGVYDASTNTPFLVDGVGNAGDTYKTTVAGPGVNGLDFVVGDYAVYNGTVWEKSHSGADNVTSVFGRLGPVVAVNGDYTASQITNVPSGNISSTNVQAALNELDSEKAIDANVVHKTGNLTESIDGMKTFTSLVNFQAPIFLPANTVSSSPTNPSIGGSSGRLAINSAGSTSNAALSTSLLTTTRIFEFPNQAGTFALTSDLSAYALDANVVHLTGNETIIGTKTFNKTPGITNIISNNNSSGFGIRSVNSSNGIGIRSDNSNVGNGIESTNTSTGMGISSSNSAGFGIYSNNTGSGVGIFSDNGSTGHGITSNGTLASTGFIYRGQNNGVNTFTVDKLGNINSTTFVKSGATASNILLAGGSDIPQSTFVPPTRTISINGVTQDLSANRSYRAGLSNTGVLTYGGINVGSSTTINVGAVTGIITDNETTPGTPSYLTVSYAGGTGITVPTIGSGTGTYVLLNSAGALVFQNTFPTSAQRKSMIYLSKISHPNLATISFAIDEPDFVNSPLQQFRDLFQVIQYMNQGITISGNAGLTINSTNGVVLGDGINFVLDKTNPNMLSVAAGAPRNFLLLNQSGAVGSFVTTIDPANYDVGGVTTPIGGSVNSTTIQYLYYAPGVGFAILRGQTVYPTLLDAVSAVGRESFVLRPNLVNNSILIAAICLRRTTTAMNDPAYVRILLADKFGQIGGASSGISVTNLQTAYNNSLIPQITTTSALGALTLREGGALDTDNVLAIQNLAGNNTLTINGNGLLTATNTGATQINGLSLTNNGTTSNARSINIENNSSGIAIRVGNNSNGLGYHVANFSIGNGIQSSNISTGNGILVDNQSTGIGTWLNSVTSSTGDLLRTTKNLLTTTKIDHLGVITSSPSVSASSALARGMLLNPALTATANNDNLIGLEVNPTFINGAFTGVTNFWARFLGSSNSSVTTLTKNINTNGYSGYASQDDTGARFMEVGIANSTISTGASYGLPGEAFLRASTSSTGVHITTSGNNNIRFSTNGGVEKMRLFNTGNLTLQNGGTFSDAGYRLDVIGGQTRLGGTLHILTPSNITNLATRIVTATDAMLADTAGAYKYLTEVQQNSSTNLSRLQTAAYRRVVGTAWQGTAFRIQYAVDGSFTDGSKAFIEIGASDPNSVGGGFVSLGTSGVDRLSVFNSGNVGIGITTDNGYRLDVQGSARFTTAGTDTSYTSVLVNGFTLGSRVGGVAPMIATRTASTTAVGFLQLAIQNADVARTNEADIIFRTGTEVGNVMQPVNTTGTAFAFQNSTINLFTISRQGTLNITTAPTNSVGGYDILTRNTSNGVIEKIPSSSVITGSGANGQVSFWNGTNSQTGDSNFIWDNAAKTLTISAEGSSNPFVLKMYSTTLSQAAGIVGQRYNGTKASPTAVLANQPLTGLYGQGYDGVSIVLNTAAIRLLAHSDFTPTSQATLIDFATTPVGSINRLTRMVIDQAGQIQINTTPLTASSTYDLLVRNTSNGYVEKVPSTTFAIDSNLVHLTGNENITGLKSFSNSSGAAINATTNSSFPAILGQSTGIGNSFLSNASSSGNNFVANQTGTGFNFVGQNNSVNTFTIDKLGNIIGNSAKFTNLAGTGIRTVVADASGNLSATISSTSNGTFTPSLTGSFTGLKSYYSKEGNILTVHLNFRFSATAGSSTSSSVLTLPNSYTLANSVAGRGVGTGAVTYGSNISVGGVFVQERAVGSSVVDFTVGNNAWITSTYDASVCFRVEVN